MEDLESGGSSPGMLKRTMLSSLAFVIGFSVIFVFLGASANYIGSVISKYEFVFNRIAGIIIIVLGLHLSGVLRIRGLYRHRKLHIKKSRIGPLGAFSLGAAFALGWTPCVGPILAGILTLAATEETIARGMVLLLAYSAGIGIPFLLTALAVGEFIKIFRRWGKWIRWAEVIAGVVLIAVGILIFTDEIGVLMRYVPEYFYKFAR